jgi:hypothetical protein
MRGLLLAALALGSLTALPAAASATVVPNVCQYSFDGFYREIPIGMAGTPAINAAPPRYPVAGGSVVNPGQTVTLDSVPGQPLDVALPENLQRFGYQAGLLSPGSNVLNVKVWVAIRATNTVEGVQILGPLAVTASTTIETSTGDNTGTFVSATPFSYAKPDLPQTTWTATGGEVVFSQAEGGTLGSLPVGNADALRPLAGSVVIQAVINANLSFFMDCRPGSVPVINPVDGAGPNFVENTPPPIDASITGANNSSCISNQGRLATGPAANLPAGVSREIDAIGVRLSSAGNPAEIALGASYTVAAGNAEITLPGDTVATLGRQVDGVTQLVTAKSYPLDLWVTLAATNTVEGTQTVRATGTYAFPPGMNTPDGTPGMPVVATLVLPSTTWTPAGAGTIRVAAGQPGSMAPISVSGNSAADPLGPVATTPYAVAPFGSIVLRAGTDINPVTLDCMPAAIAVTDPPAAPFSNLGTTGAAGRYSISANPRPDALATTRVLAPPPPVADVPAAVAPPPPPPPAAALPLPRPTATTASSGPGKFGFTKLKNNKGRIRVVVSCAASKTTCAGTLQVRTAAKQRLTRRAKSKIVTIARDTRYTVNAGKLKTITLTLSADARRLLRSRRSVKVKAVLKPSRGAQVTRTLNLSR